MQTPTYVKMDAHDQLLLSEGLCRQLRIFSYHDKVEQWRGGKSKHNSDDADHRARVPMVKVRLVKTTTVEGVANKNEHS